MPRSVRFTILVATCVAAAACGSSTEPRNGALAVTSDGAAVTLTNRKPWPVFYILADPGFLALADFVLCDDPQSSCPRVPPNGTVRVPYDQIAGHTPGRPTVQVMEWRLVAVATGRYEQRDFRSDVYLLR